MPLQESIGRFANGGLDQSKGLTKLSDGAATIAKNVELYPNETVAKRSGYIRAQDIGMVSAMVVRFEFDRVFISVDSTGNIDAT